MLHLASTIEVPDNSPSYKIYSAAALKYIASVLLYIHRLYIYIYAYFFPYSFLPLDQVCDEFSRCFGWSGAVIRAFAWHPTYDRCALAICNDYIYVYQGPTRIRVLRHSQQRKITELVWHPSHKEILFVATQKNLIMWRVSDNHTHPISLLNDINSTNAPAYLSPALQMVMRKKDKLDSSPMVRGLTRLKDTYSTQDDAVNQIQTNQPNDFMILKSILPPPIISLKFDQSGNRLYACSPNSSKIAVLKVDAIIDEQLKTNTIDRKEKGRDEEYFEYVRTFGRGFTKLLWSPKKDRLATITTSNLIRMFEPFSWTYNQWSIHNNPIQDVAWSHPHGRMLLIANKTEPYLYALTFLDNSQAGDVGGNKSVMKALDLTATRTENGDLIGGVVQSLAWDKSGKRLAISFKENSESILLYKTVEKPTVEFHQLGVIQSETGSYPLLMEFHDRFKTGSLLTVCWSDGSCQHIPMFYSPNENTHNGSFDLENSINRSLNNSSFNMTVNDPRSSPKTPRSLTNFCLVSGNNSISSYPSSLMPLNKVQHQTTLYSLATKSPFEVSRDSLESNDVTKDYMN